MSVDATEQRRDNMFRFYQVGYDREREEDYPHWCDGDPDYQDRLRELWDAHGVDEDDFAELEDVKELLDRYNQLFPGNDSSFEARMSAYVNRFRKVRP